MSQLLTIPSFLTNLTRSSSSCSLEICSNYQKTQILALGHHCASIMSKILKKSGKIDPKARNLLAKPGAVVAFDPSHWSSDRQSLGPRAALRGLCVDALPILGKECYRAGLQNSATLRLHFTDKRTKRQAPCVQSETDAIEARPLWLCAWLHLTLETWSALALCIWIPVVKFPIDQEPMLKLQSSKFHHFHEPLGLSGENMGTAPSIRRAVNWRIAWERPSPWLARALDLATGSNFGPIAR